MDKKSLKKSPLAAAVAGGIFLSAHVIIFLPESFDSDTNVSSPLAVRK